MSNDAEKLLRLKKRVTLAREARIRAETTADNAERELRTLGYNTVDEAEKALQDIDKRLFEGEERLALDIEAFHKKYPEL